MTIPIISSLSAFLVSTIIAFFILKKAPHHPVTPAFIPLVMFAGIWCLFPVAAEYIGNHGSKLLVLRLIYITAVLTGPAFLNFGLSVTNRKISLLGINVSVIAYTMAIALFAYGIFSKDLIVSVYKIHDYHVIVPGANYTLLILFFSVTCAGSFVALYSSFLNSQGYKRNQYKFLFIAYFFAFISAVIHFGAAFGIREFFPHDFFVVTCMFIVAYTIFKHKLLDVDLIIKRTAIFAGLFAFVYGTFTTITIIGQEFFRSSLGWNQWIAMIPTVAIITFTLRPLENFLTNATEKFLFQKKYDYRDLLKTFTNDVLKVIDLQSLPKETVEGLTRIIKLESCYIFVKDKDTKQYVMVSHTGPDDAAVFGLQEELIGELATLNEPVLRAKVESKSFTHAGVKELFDLLAAHAIIPIRTNNELIGLLCLGAKKSGADFTDEDMVILSALVRTLAIAISNAQLFAELSITQAEAAQREKMAVIGTLAAGINHEICNPLGIVRGQCELFMLNSKEGFLNDMPKEEIINMASETMTKVIKETDRATAITRKLSNFAKPSKANELELVSVSHEIDEVVSLVGHDLKLSNIDFEKEFPAGFPEILADKKQIQEVLFNLIRNAAQAMDKQRGLISVSGEIEEHEVIVRIRDNGSGIPADKVKQIFHPFYTTKSPGKGTGLGLFIVKQVIQKNKGDISVESVHGEGTVFSLRFPIAQKSAKAA